jgi:uncharacterized protein (DUF58 family)
MHFMPFMPMLRRRFSPADLRAWRAFGIAMGVLAFAFMLALFSAAASELGKVWLAGTLALGALALAGWVAITIVPTMAKRTSLRWLAHQLDYRLTREGFIYLGVVVVLVVAAVNTGNNLLFLVLSCLLAGILVSGALSRIVLAGVELKSELPEHIFAGQSLSARVELANEKIRLPSFSLRVSGSAKAGVETGDILTQPVYFPYIAHGDAAVQHLELRFARRGAYRHEELGLSTRFPFGFLEKTRRVHWNREIVVYPRVKPTGAYFELLPRLSGEITSFYRGRGNELHGIRDYNESDSARFVDWKITAKTGGLKVREFAREDERRVMIVLDPFRPTLEEPTGASERIFLERFESAVTLAASLMWHFSETASVAQFRCARRGTPPAPANEIVYDALRELALVSPEPPGGGSTFLDTLAGEPDMFKVILTARLPSSIPAALWSSSHFIFFDSL